MSTKRTPIARPPVTRITPAAIRLYGLLRRVKGGKEWWDIHDQLHDELRLPPWEFPIGDEWLRALDQVDEP
jgi:hypothetical protein